MTFSILLERVQNQTPKISTNWVRDQVIDLSDITSIKEQWTGVVDPSVVRGWYVEGPQGPPVTLSANEALVVLSRDLDKSWRRMVFTKELMHTFDADEEKTDTVEKFHKLVERLSNPNADSNPFFVAETKAVWRALAVLCPEEFRLEQKEKLEAGGTTIEQVAARLRIPRSYASNYFRDDYPEIINMVR